MKLKFKKQKGKRIKTSYFRNITTHSDLWFSNLDNKLKTIEECKKDGKGFSSHSNKKCKSVKAFKRFVHKNKHLLEKGNEFILVSKYVGYDVIYIK